MADSKDVRILIVEDSPQIRKTIRFLLKHLGFRNSMALENASLGLKELKERKYDLLLLDWNMPGKSGLNMLKEIRQDPILKVLPVIMVTGESRRTEISMAVQAGVNAYILKPFSAELLEKKILAIFSDKKVLVIDDDAHIRRLLELKLKSKGYQVIMARDGEEGLNLIEEQQPDVVITDINLPKLDGESLCKQTNDLKKERPFLTIVMTNRISPEDRNWTKEMHDTLFMGKPFSPSKLLESIDKYFGMRR